MRRFLVLAGIVAAGTVAMVPAPGAGTMADGGMAGVESMTRARQNWILQCQGCHTAHGGGNARTTPAVANVVSRFLGTPGGRDYLVRVPGVATAPLKDKELAELMNWTLFRFDPAHVPADFQPYTPEEVGRLRQNPLRTEAPAVRARLVATFGDDD